MASVCPLVTDLNAVPTGPVRRLQVGTDSWSSHVVLKSEIGPKAALTTDWVPEGSLAGFLLGAFLRSGRPRGPGKALKKVGGEAPHIFEGLFGAPGPARRQTGTPKKSGQTAFRYPRRPFRGPGAGQTSNRHSQKVRPDCLQVPNPIGTNRGS
jgi:hypothetical protein